MKEKRSLLWRWCPQPERMRATRTRPTDRPWVPLVASALLLSLLAIQGAQMWSPSAVNVIYPNIYSPAPAAQPFAETPTQTSPASQTVTTISTDHFTVQLTFPESADPGNTITISTTTTAKSSGQVDNLSIEVLAYVNRQLAKATSATVLTNRQVRSGNTWQTTLTVTISPNADRSVMVGIVTETWEEMSSYYNSYGYLPYYYPSYPYNYTVHYVYEPSYVTIEKSSQQTLPLTYILATTPEYEQLSAQYKALLQEYDSLLAKHNELSSKYEALRSDYDQLTSSYNQLGSQYKATSLELSDFRIYTYILIVITIGLAAALAFLVFRTRQANKRQESNTSSLRDK
jgi:outer membrane murein-binding lipoprotein Lpp